MHIHKTSDAKMMDTIKNLCFKKLHIFHRQIPARQEKVGRKQPSCTQKGKTAGQEREKEVGREEKREGGR